MPDGGAPDGLNHAMKRLAAHFVADQQSSVLTRPRRPTTAPVIPTAAAAIEAADGPLAASTDAADLARIRDELAIAGNDDGVETPLEEPTIEPAVEIPIDEEAELVKVRALRAELGLPEKSPLLFEPPTEAEKRAVLDPFYERRLQARLEENGGMGFIDRNKKQIRSERTENELYHSNSGRVHKLAVEVLERTKIPHARELVHVLSERGLSSGNLPTEVRNIIAIGTCGLSAESVGIAIDRLQILGFRIYSGSELRKALLVKGFSSTLATIANADEGAFENVCKELNQYHFLSRQAVGDLSEESSANRHPVLNGNVSFYADLLKEGRDGSMTEAEKKGLDLRLKKSLLQKDRSWPYDVQLGSLPDDAQAIELTEDMVYQWLQATPDIEETIDLNSHFFQNVTEYYDPIKAALDESIAIPYSAATRDLSWTSPEKLIDCIAQVQQFAQPKSKREWIALMQELRGEEMIKAYQHIDELESGYENRVALADLAVIIHALPTELGVNFANSVRYGRNWIDTSALTEKITTVDMDDARLSDEDRAYIGATGNFLARSSTHVRSVDIKFAPVVAFLARNKGDIQQYLLGRGYGFKAALIEKIAQGELVVSDDALSGLLADHYMRKLPDTEPISTDTMLRFNKLMSFYNLTDALSGISVEAITDSPHLQPIDRDVLLAVKQYPEFNSVLLEQRNRLNEFVSDGKITPAFCYEVAKSGARQNLSLLLSDDVLSTFPESEQRFWGTMKEHEQLNKFLLDNRARFDDFFIFEPVNQADMDYAAQPAVEGVSTVMKGRLTPAFCQEASAGLNNFSYIVKLLDDPLLATFPPEDREFWTTVKAHMPIGQFLRDHRDNFDQFFTPDGMPTPALCNQAGGTNASALTDMLSDDVLATFPEGEKEFWTTVKNNRGLASTIIPHRAEFDAQGRPTPAFCYDALHQSNGDKFIELLTDDVLAAFPPEERAFWSEVKKHGSISTLVNTVKTGQLSRERLTQVLQENRDVVDTEFFLGVALESPEIVLGTDEGLTFFKQIFENGLQTGDSSHDRAVGQQFIALQQKLGYRAESLILKIASKELDRTDKLLEEGEQLEIDGGNWNSLLMAYVRSQADVYNLPALSAASAEKVKVLFDDPRVRDTCLTNLRNEWLTYLQAGEAEQMPFTLYFTTEFIKYCDGAGPMSQVESLSTFINSYQMSMSRGASVTAERTHKEVFQGVAAVEARFSSERWSNEDRADFYNISSDILQAEPRIFSDYLELFQQLGPADLKRFTRELYPLYKAKLALIEGTDGSGPKAYDMKHLIDLRRDIRGFSRALTSQENPFEVQKTKLVGEITNLFKDRFGIVKIPEEFTPEHMRSLTNSSVYLANLNARNETKETVLGHYLSLMINDRWDDFRRGQIIDPREYVIPERAAVMQGILDRRQELSPLTPENIGISSDEMPEFMALLQQETQNVMIGDVETIDVKLGNVIINLRGLEDPDLYPELLDKQRMQLALSFGNKRVGAAAAKMYQTLANPERAIQFSPEEESVRDEIIRIARDNGIEITAANLKTHFQDGMKPFSTVANLLQSVHDTEAEPQIGTLREMLQSSQEIIDIFNRLGEDFKPTSGALALSQDLNYLDNLIVKREAELTTDERTMLTGYTGRIREQVVLLQSIYDQIRNKFSSTKQGNLGTENPLLKDKLEQIDRIVNNDSTQQSVTSTITGNMNTIIENIRECLSCTRQGINNDTDLTFGDPNKFYLYSQSESQVKGSIADQIVFLEPITHQDGMQEMAFVFDRVYGTNTPLILTNQLETVVKKYRALKRRFPEAKLSIFVTNSAMTTAGLSSDLFSQRLHDSLGQQALISEEHVEVDVAESALGDHYIEFGGESRKAGKREVGGLVIRL